MRKKKMRYGLFLFCLLVIFWIVSSVAHKEQKTVISDIPKQREVVESAESVECTVEALARKYPDRYAQLQQKLAERKLAVQQDFAEEVAYYDSILQFASGLDELQFPVITLPTIELDVKRSLPDIVARYDCQTLYVSSVASQESLEKKFEFPSLPHILALSVAWLQKDLAEDQHNGHDDYYFTTVGLLTGFPLEVGNSSFKRRETLYSLLPELENEKKLFVLTPKLLELLQQVKPVPILTPYFAHELRKFWTASHEDFPLMQLGVATYEIFLHNPGFKRGGWFLRRWMSKGGGEAGDELILLYRYWMVRAASILELDETSQWARETALSMERVNTLRHKSEYLSDLKNISLIQSH